MMVAHKQNLRHAKISMPFNFKGQPFFYMAFAGCVIHMVSVHTSIT